MSQQVLISAQDLKKYFPVKGFLGGKTKYLKAVDGVTLDIMKGETFGLVGESGCGKSTLGRTLIRMYDVTGGKLSYQGKDITNAKPSEMKEFRNKMQIIFQDPYSAVCQGAEALCVRHLGEHHPGKRRPMPALSAKAVRRVLTVTQGNTAQFPPYGLSTTPAAAARHLRCQNAR